MAYTVTEGTFKVGKGVELYTKTWMPSETPVKAKLVFVHGFSDHIHRYYEFFPTLASRGIAVYGYDQRGWGKSAPLRADWGNMGPNPQIMADTAAFVEDKLGPASASASASASAATPALASKIPESELTSTSTATVPHGTESKPNPSLFVMGHSMGGGEVLTLASDEKYKHVVERVHGWIVEGPFIGFTKSEEPSFLKVFFGRLAGKIMPRFQLHNPIPPELVSRDPDVVRSVREDPMCHNIGTLEAFAATLDRAKWLSSGEVLLPTDRVRSLLVLHGDADQIADYTKCRNWYSRQHVADSTFKGYKDGMHQLHADLCKDEFYDDVASWILARSEGSFTARL